ncbi:tyrosine-type recombinase/integrase [Actinocatenispora rupis]|uniref:Site-specific integrase n=1 Tax=Actinocatenispora rupis TaxID=519421 RepID=A0A8J3J6V4_9ACTN|nr:tyrosine-type recombinase/integrase [Actinocatenispora rupis]GID13067.1 site-specific integrase [Actinocatenispora rupis]
MSTSYDVTVYEIQERKDRKRATKRKNGTDKVYRLRWTVQAKRFERNFAGKALADGFRTGLLHAVKAGDPFDADQGLPLAMLRAQSRRTWLEVARSYVEARWTEWAPKSRRSAVDALATVTVALVSDDRGAPPVAELRHALYSWALNANRWGQTPSDTDARAYAWLARHSLPVTRLLESPVIRDALNACARKMDGKPAAATTVARKRAVLYNALGYAVELELLDYNPIDKVQWKAPAVAEQVDRRVVANTAQVEAILAELPNVDRHGAQYTAFFGCLYYGGMRPAEAASIRRGDCQLPRKGWGRIILAETAPHAGEDWTDDGTTREPRGLKHRAAKETRTVPIPPDLVRLLQAHLDTFGTTEDGRLFRAARGGYLSEAQYGRIWKRARAAALSEEQTASPLVGRPYDLRHAAVSVWLNGGVPAPEVARRVGHGVAVLLKVYAGCIDGEEETVNRRIEQAIRSGRGRGAIGGQNGPNPNRRGRKGRSAA